jgi:hypothetical protein
MSTLRVGTKLLIKSVVTYVSTLVPFPNSLIYSQHRITPSYVVHCLPFQARSLIQICVQMIGVEAIDGILFGAYVEKTVIYRLYIHAESHLIQT